MKNPEMEDNEIVYRCLEGEIEVFEMLVKKYQGNILGLSWNILGNKEEAKDVTQEVFIQSFINLRCFDGTRNFKRWLFSIAYKRCLDRKKKERTWGGFLKNKAFELSLNNPLLNEERNIENSEIFGPILNKLNKKERTAISLKVNEAYSAKEIAQIIDCAESTVRVLIFNAKRKLRKILEKMEDV